MSLKLMFEDDASIKYNVDEVLNESTGVTEKKYHIKGTFSTIGARNRNGRVYPRSLWEREVNAYQANFANGSINTLMEVEHPPRANVDPMEAVAKIVSLGIEGDKVVGDAVLLDNPKADQIKTLIDNGIKISVSSRACGSYDANGTVKEFKLITYDIVANPSDYNATMNGVCESYMLTEGVLDGVEFYIDENGSLKKVQKLNEEINSADVKSADEFYKEVETPKDSPAEKASEDVPEQQNEDNVETFTKEEISEAIAQKIGNFFDELINNVSYENIKEEYKEREEIIKRELPLGSFIHRCNTLRIRIDRHEDSLYTSNFMDPYAKLKEPLDDKYLEEIYNKLVDKLKRYSDVDVKKIKFIYLKGDEIDVKETLNGMVHKKLNK